MTIQRNAKNDPAPSHPGRMIQMVLIEDMGLTQQQLADKLFTNRDTVNKLINGKRNLSPEMALRLGKFAGNGARIWMAMQTRFDLYYAKIKNEKILSQIVVSNKQSA